MRWGFIFFTHACIQFQQCQADSLPFPENSFDIAVRRLGVMFFPDSRVMDQHVESTAVDPDAPSASRFAEPGKLASLLMQAGAVDVKENIVEFDIAAPISPIEFWTLRSQISDTLRHKLQQLSQDEQSQVAREIERAVRKYFPHDEMSFPADLIIVTGKKPN